MWMSSLTEFAQHFVQPIGCNETNLRQGLWHILMCMRIALTLRLGHSFSGTLFVWFSCLPPLQRQIKTYMHEYTYMFIWKDWRCCHVLNLFACWCCSAFRSTDRSPYWPYCQVSLLGTACCIVVQGCFSTRQVQRGCHCAWAQPEDFWGALRFTVRCRGSDAQGICSWPNLLLSCFLCNHCK